MDNRFTDNGDNTVTDTKTNLTWAKEDDGKERNWKDAKEFCEKNEMKLPGEGWRMPTREELLTIVDLERYRPAIDPIFRIAEGTWFWSSTPYAGDSGLAWIVPFHDGGVDWGNIDYEYFVRPVRQNSL